MARLKQAPPRGIVNTRVDVEPIAFEHRRFEVDPPLHRSIEHFWSVAWHLPPGVVQERSTLPHPSIHVVLEPSPGDPARGIDVDVVGVVRGRFTWRHQGRGFVFAAKFRPGAFRGLLGAPVATLTDRVVPLASVVGAKRARTYRDEILAARDDDARVAVATRFFAAVLPEPAPDAALLAALVDAAVRDRGLTVEALAARAGMSVRSLQRWFHDAVGISPKWMLQRYRLHEALLALESAPGNLADVAAALGYADQPHFARELKALVGVTPSSYRRGVTR